MSAYGGYDPFPAWMEERATRDEPLGQMCPACHGFGTLNADLPDVERDHRCDECDGTGLVYF